MSRAPINAVGANDGNGSRMDFRSLWAYTVWTVALAWSTRASLTVAIGLLALVRGVVPAGLALFARGLVNATVALTAGETTSLRPIVMWLALGCMVSLIDAMAPAATQLCHRRLVDELNLRITSDVLVHAATLDLEFFESPKHQDILERARQDTAARATHFLHNAIEIGTNGLQLASLVGILAVIEPLVPLLVAPFALPYVVFKWRLAAQRYREVHERTAKLRWTAYFVNLLTDRDAVAESKMLDLAPQLVLRFRELMESFRDRDRLLHRREFFGSWLFGAAMTLVFFGLFFRVVQRVVAGVLTLGDVAVFGAVSSRLRQSVDLAILSISSARENALHIANLIEFLALEPKVVDAPEPRPLDHVGSIEFEDVWFTYPGAEQATLRGVTMQIARGEIAGLVGENGSGKTTLVKLLCRLYDPDRGAIRFDGVDIRELAVDQLRSQVAFIFQHYGRYEASAADNIAYGDWRKLLTDRSRVEEAARQAGIARIIEEMPDGYDTFIGRRFGGYDLSGGRWQYLALGRAFARDASLLVLDEPTASLDAAAEFELFSRFRDLARGHTTLLISHRFSTIGMADRILVMGEGRIVESGTHEELLASDGGYAALYRLHRRQMGDPLD
ncbi:MAG: ABC transporter ATP-binding protein [Acidobacteriota bacterium]|nr:ABC transporter ATP-binding protein [Acidobacteriota bacterium]